MLHRRARTEGAAGFHRSHGHRRRRPQFHGTLLNDTIGAAHERAGFAYKKLSFDPGMNLAGTYISASAENGDHLFDIYNSTSDYIAVAIDGREIEYYAPILKAPYSWTSTRAPERFHVGSIPSNSAIKQAVPAVRSFRETMEGFGVSNLDDSNASSEIQKMKHESKTPDTGIWSVAEIDGVAEESVAGVLNWLSTIGLAESDYELPDSGTVITNVFKDSEGKPMFEISWESDRTTGYDDYVWISVNGSDPKCYNIYITGETGMTQSLLETYGNECLLTGTTTSYWFDDLNWIHISPR
jgi:hypothetical protein